MLRSYFIIFLISGLLLTISSCNNKSVYNMYKTIPKASWDKDSVMVFEVQVANTSQNHNLYVNVRNDIDYKYSNLWLFVKITQPGDTAVTDTFEVTLADPAGKWLGKGFGGIKTNENLFRQHVYFPKAGTYNIAIQHGMREIVLGGITDVGIRIEKQ